MVAIFTGAGTGAERGSANVLGRAGLLGSGTLGRSGEQVLLNAATGNLMIARQDEFLVGRGPDAVVNRTYNSLGDLSDDNGDNWRQSTQRRVYDLQGTANTAGSSIKRVAGDGSVTTYSWDGTSYVSTEGTGAYDHITYDSAYNTWKWHDGDTQAFEVYNGPNYQIDQLSDPDGAEIYYSYTGNQLTDIYTANGEKLSYGWSGNNLSTVARHYKDPAGNWVTNVRTSYEYDSLNRLSGVTVDLTPADNLVADGNVYHTTYTYQGNSTLVASIAQTDGSRLEVDYDGQGRVQALREFTTGTSYRQTSISYASGSTSVTDALGQVTTLAYDAANQLTGIALPPAAIGQSAITTSFTYNVKGDLVGATDGTGAATIYDYDDRGNLTHVGRPAGDDVWRRYDAANQLVVETRVASDEVSAGEYQSTRYTYDQYQRLRFTIAADGTVTENQRGYSGRVYQVRQYMTSRVDVSALAWDAAIDNATMESWAAGADKTGDLVTAYDYDERLEVVQSYRFAGSDAYGYVNYLDGTTHDYFTYDQTGQLLQHVLSGQNGYAGVAETYVYDGLGRLTASTDAAGATTSIVFQDAATTTIVTSASGLVTTSTYNKAGELVSTMQTGAYATGGITYRYDALGRVRGGTDGNGIDSYVVYDRLSRKVADITQDGAVTEYRYDADDRLVATVRYANRLDAAQRALAADTGVSPDMSALRPAGDAADIYAWSVYDQGGRLIETLSGDGSAERFDYDTGDRLIRTTRFVGKVAVSVIDALKTGAPTGLALPAADANDEVTRTFYDRLGRLVGTLDGEGHLTHIVYDAGGRAVLTTVFHNLAGASLRATGTLAQLVASCGTHASDAATRSVYDGQGFLRFRIDGLGGVTEYGYIYHTPVVDYNETATGNVRQVTHYAGMIGTLGSYTVDSVRQAVAGLASNPANRTSYSVYDPAGRLTYTIDAGGAVTGYRYDAGGNLVRKTDYADLRATPYLPTRGEMDGWSGGVAGNAANRVTRYFYDAADRLRFSIDAEGYVTGSDYDAGGQLVSTTLWSVAVAATDSWTIANVAAAATGTTATTSFHYDAAGRVSRTTDAAGSTTDTVYRGNGTIQYTIASDGTADVSRTRYDYDGNGRLVGRRDAAGTAYETLTSFTYDGAGNLVGETDADGHVTTHGHDRAGRLISTTDALGHTTTYDYDALGNQVRIVDADGNATWSYYDKLGRIVAVRDAENYVTETNYTVFGEVSSVTRRAMRTLVAASADALPTVTPDAKDATTTFYYDRLGRVITTRDAGGHADQQWYDAFGQIVQTLNKLGGVTRNVYDRRGLLVAQTQPIGTSDEWGGAPARAASATQFDAFYYGTSYADLSGMLWNPSWLEWHWNNYGHYEGRNPNAFFNTSYYLAANPDVAAGGVNPLDHYRTYGMAEGRRPSDIVTDPSPALTGGVVTRFDYDARGNRTRMIEAAGLAEQRTTTYAYDAVGRLASKSGDAVQVVDATNFASFTAQVPTETYAYDRRGNLIRSVDANGAATFSYYDALDRKIAQVDAVGTLTHYAYDPAGNLTRMTVWGTPVALPATPGGTPPAAPGGESRVTDYAYDALDRLTSTGVENVRTGAWNGTSFQLALGTVTTSYVYDALGNVLRTTDGAGGSTYAYHDRLGRTTREVDAEGFVTDWGYDAEGNVRYEYRWANATPSWGLGGAVDPAYQYQEDRVTTFAYDLMGRRTAEYRDHVESWRVYGNGELIGDNDGSAIYYAYNALGQVISKTEATGDVTTYGYDVAGRLVAEMRAGFVDGDGVWAVPVLRYGYDGLGDLVRTSQGAEGGGEERVTRYDYAAGGRLSRSVDAAGAATDYGYDAAGNVLRQSYGRRDADWNWSYEGALYTRDALGRIVAQTVGVYDGAAWAGGDIQRIEYDAYGAVARRGLNGVWQERFVYDAAGQLAQSNTGDGVWRFHLHDGAGRETLTLESAGADLVGQSRDAVLAMMMPGGAAPGSVPVPGIVLSVAVLDRRGQQVATWLPGRQLADSEGVQDLWTHRTTNAFGEVTGESDARGNWTHYRYNTMGRMVEVTHPGVWTTDAHGVTSFAAPVEHRYYDRSGRLVGTRDANGNATAQALLAGTGYGGSEALVTAEFHADGGVKRQGYTRFGELRSSTDEIGRRTWMRYDAMGRLVEVTRPGGHGDHYDYDQLGRQVRHMLDADQLPYWDAELTWYDAQGRVIRQRGFGYEETATSYAWHDAANAGLGTQGGWDVTVTRSNGRTSFQRSDLFGHVLSSRDLGGRVTEYGYDPAGRLARTTGPETVD
ncbi:hypothetical protein, partial [uncultured Sphingomonas sp.]|uniref:hypothetical protein n=1 Tax=uncultured Sphingomonas sp. TaxID=158754 RepID=UPI0035CC68DF